MSTEIPLTRLGCALLGHCERDQVGEHSHEIGASIGAALIPDDGATAEAIIHNADLAMYRAKAQDRPSLVFSEPTADHPRQIA